MARHLPGSDVDSGVAVGVPVVVPKGVVLRTVPARVSGSVWLHQTGFASVGTTPVCGSLKASLLVVQSAVPERQ